MNTTTTDIIDNNEIRIGHFPADDTEAYAYRDSDGDWWVRSHGGSEGEHPIAGETISEEIADTINEYNNKSVFAAAMLHADELAKKTSITRQQAEMYVAREELKWSRSDVANRWRVSESNVDELVRRAKRKIGEARNLVELID